MTEAEKKQRGAFYDTRDPELRAQQNRAKDLMRAYNLLPAGDQGARTRLLSRLFGGLGSNARVNQPVYVDYGYNIFLGNNSFINMHCTLLDTGKITIGDRTLLGPDVKIYTALHPMDCADRFWRRADGAAAVKTRTMPVSIGDDTWIGGGSVILPGVAIGSNVVIGAGSVVTESIPDNAIACGNPCKVVKRNSSPLPHSGGGRPELPFPRRQNQKGANPVKKLLSILLSAVLAISLAACGAPSPSGGNEGAASSPADPEISASEETPGVPEPSPESARPEAGGALVAYFSWSGNTRQVAQIIQQEVGGDLFEIIPAAPYTDDYNALLDIARQEQAEAARPELAEQVENWDSYEVVFVGYPNWWSDAPMAVYTFLESYDWTGKTMVPFNTSASGGFGRSLDGLAESAAGAAVLEGLSFTERTQGDAQNRVSDWLDSLDLS